MGFVRCRCFVCVCCTVSSVTVTHDGSTCGGTSYLASLTESLQAGMVLTLSLVRHPPPSGCYLFHVRMRMRVAIVCSSLEVISLGSTATMPPAGHTVLWSCLWSG